MSEFLLALRALDGRNAYSLLDVTPTASEENLQRAYRAAARRLHPDVTEGPDTAQMTLVATAYKLLRKHRDEYDRELAAEATRQRAAPQDPPNQDEDGRYAVDEPWIPQTATTASGSNTTESLWDLIPDSGPSDRVRSGPEQGEAEMPNIRRDESMWDAEYLENPHPFFYPPRPSPWRPDPWQHHPQQPHYPFQRFPPTGPPSWQAHHRTRAALPAIRYYYLLAVVACIVFPPLGIPALTNSIQAKKSAQAGDASAAHRASSRALQLGVYAIVVVFVAALVLIHRASADGS